MPKGSNPDPAERVRIAERREKAIQLRLAGMTYEKIAEQLNYAGGRAQVYNDIQRARKQVNKDVAEGLEELRQVTHDRYERLLLAHWPAALQRDEKSTRAVLQILAQQSALDGTNAPKDLNIQLERRQDVEAALVMEAVLAAFDSAGLPPELRLAALEAAQRRLAAADDGQVVAGEIIRSESGDE